MSQSLYSQALHSKSLRSSNGTRYQISGAHNAPVIAFIHGLGLNRGIWDTYVNHFAKDYRVLSYDLYGHGESAAPPYKPSVRQFSEQLIELMDELEIEHCAAVGFSLGGMINRRMAIDHPDRVSALAILNSPHERGEEAQSLVEQRALDSAAGGPGATVDATIERWFTPEFRRKNPKFIEQVRGWVLANDVEIYALCRQVLAFGVVELIRPEPPITHPTLVMTCENDSGSTPAMSQAIASEIGAARVVIVPHLKHMGLTENEALFIDELTPFLNTTLTR